MERLIAIDFETHLISNESPVPKPVCISHYTVDEYGKERKGIITGSDGMEAFLFDKLSCSCKVIAHNMSFEANVIDTHFPKLRKLLYRKLDLGQLICTKINEQILECKRKKLLHKADLASIVNHYFKVDISEDKKNPDAWRLRYNELDGVPLEQWPKEAIDYAIDDSMWAYKVYKVQEKIDYKEAVAADFYLNKMASFGLLVDKERVLQLEQELLTKLTPMYQKLQHTGHVEKDTKGRYRKKMNTLRETISNNIKDYEKTAKGTVATTTEVMEKYVASLPKDNPVVEIFESYLGVMKYEKMMTAYVTRLKTADPYIRTSYKAMVSTGRTSSSSSMNYPSVNIQQMPRSIDDVTWDVRNCFIPRPGYKICSIDYNGLELSSTAHQLKTLTRRDDMLKIINGGDSPVDMHSMLAYRIMNIKEKDKETYESFVARKKEKKYAEYRQIAKPINLGFPGGVGYDTMRTLLAKEGISPKFGILNSSEFEARLIFQRNKAKMDGYPVRIQRTGFREYKLVYDELVELKQTLFGLYPDLEYFLTEGHKEYLTGKTKPMKNEFGEWENEPMYRFYVQGLERDWCTYTQICNGLLMQCPSAIGAKRAMVKIISKYGNSVEVNPLAFIHDEIVFEVLDIPEKYAIIKDISEILIDEMQSVLTSVRIAVEAEIFPYWKKAGGEWDKTYWKDSNSKELKEK